MADHYWVDGNKMGVTIGKPDEDDNAYKYVPGIGAGNFSSGAVTMIVESAADRLYREYQQSKRRAGGFLAERFCRK